MSRITLGVPQVSPSPLPFHTSDIPANLYSRPPVASSTTSAPHSQTSSSSPCAATAIYLLYLQMRQSHRERPSSPSGTSLRGSSWGTIMLMPVGRGKRGSLMERTEDV